MRTRVIPAQITTVEDKIAGNLNLTQILLLMAPVFWTAISYAVLPPAMHLAWYKLPLFVVVLLICLTLSIRIKNKVVINWLAVLLRYNLRPRYYVFNKNDFYLRALDLPVFEKSMKKHTAKVLLKQKAKKPSLAVRDLIKLEGIFANPRYTFSLKSGKKGGLYVAFEQIQK